MAYIIRYVAVVDWIGDGVGSMSVPSAQQLQLGSLPLFGAGFAQAPGQPIGFQVVPGGDSPTIGNFNTALAGSSSTPTNPSMAYDLYTAVNANLARIQGFSTGGG